MARLSILDPRISKLVDQMLVPLFVTERSTAALCKALNQALDGGVSGGIHPNRLHTLLSDDLSRGVHEATVELIEKAAETLTSGGSEWRQQSEARLSELRLEARRLKDTRSFSNEDIAKQLNLPPAVARHVLSADSSVSALARVLTNSHAGQPAEAGEGRPDWSFQDTAVARSVEALGRRPAARVGLVLPTGAGKTRTALRIVLTMLDRAPDSKAPVYWLTHMRNLREQAHRELQKLIGSNKEQIPAERLVVLANRIKFAMVSELPRLLSSAGPQPVLIVIDEAHHAAAPSYQLAFSDFGAAPVLLLTATPNRSDRLPIGIDEVAFTITYRELAERKVVLKPKFLDFPVDDFDWSAQAIADLADYIIDSAAAEFTKVLVLAPRLDRVEEFYRSLLDRLPPDHPLEREDIGFVHGSGNSLGIDNEDFLARFGDKPRAILVSAQLLLEGFDDPAINTVVMTYPSSSVVRLMQAAGRCVRYSPGKRAAYVVQARNDDIAYHFDQRWLYQEIDDFLRPQLVDIEYGTKTELREQVEAMLKRHNVEAASAALTLRRLDAIAPGETCRLFFYGLPYYGESEAFEVDAQWGVILENADNSGVVRSLFNGFSAMGADLSDPTAYLLRDGVAHGVTKEFTAGSRWMELTGLLTASYFAKREVYGPTPIEMPGSRPYRRTGATTWLKYCSFVFRPALSPELVEFLRDCYNAARVEAQFLDRAQTYVAAVKVPLPLAGSEATLLDRAAFEELETATGRLRAQLAEAEPQDQFGVLGAFDAASEHTKLPARLLRRAEFLLNPADRARRVLLFPNRSNTGKKEDLHG